MAPLGETLRGELRYRDGRRSTVEVPVDRTLPSIITGVRTLRERVAQLLTELTEQEKRPGDQEEQGGEEILFPCILFSLLFL